MIYQNHIIEFIQISVDKEKVEIRGSLFISHSLISHFSYHSSWLVTKSNITVLNNNPTYKSHASWVVGEESPDVLHGAAGDLLVTPGVLMSLDSSWHWTVVVLNKTKSLHSLTRCWRQLLGHLFSQVVIKIIVKTDSLKQHQQLLRCLLDLGWCFLELIRC